MPSPWTKSRERTFQMNHYIQSGPMIPTTYNAKPIDSSKIGNRPHPI